MSAKTTQSPLRELCRGVWPVQDAETERRRREHIAERVVTLNRSLAERSLLRRRQSWLLAAAALFASLGLLWLLGRSPSAPLAAQRALPAGARLVAGEASLSQGGTLVTRADQGAELRLSSDTDLELQSASEVGLERSEGARGFEERVRLRAGGVALRVPKLGTRGSVAVETQDSWIEVHGTQFSVRWVERAPLRSFTEVRVTEGKVLVRSRDGASRFLTAGDAWRSVEPEPAGVPAAAVETPPPAPVEAPRSAAAVPKLKPAPASASELAAQNRLLEGAELARKSGMPALALERLETLIGRYPAAELAHNARVQRLRLLWSMGRRSEAAGAARQYLELYAQGFARAEAQQYLDAAANGAAAP